MASIFAFIELEAFLPKDELLRFNFVMSASFLIIAVLMFLFILYSRFANGVKYVRMKKTESSVQSFLSSYIFDDSVTEIDVAAFKAKYVKNRSAREVVLLNLLTLHKSLIGETAERLRLLYQQLSLQSYSRQKLYASNWNIIAKGITELAQMKMHEHSALISNFVNHTHPILRSEAQVALVKLQAGSLFSFLGDLKNPLLEWQQQQLFKAAQQLPIKLLPEFKQWLNHRQESITIFCLRMISYYGQHNALPEILDLLDHPSAEIREEAVKTLRHLESFDAVPKLTAMYEHESIDIQLEILKTLPVIGGAESVPFYEQLLKSNDKRLQLAAAKALYKSGKQARQQMEAIRLNPEHELYALVNYASN